jgi:hypothetical protein
MRYEDIPKLATWLLDSNIFASVGSTTRVAALRAAWGTAAGPATAASAPPARRGLLRIDDLIADYAEVFSPMAKTNLLTELERAIIDWHTARPGPLPVPMAALKEVVGRKLSLRDRASRYNRAICIGYNIYCNYDKTNHHVHPNSTLNTNYYRHSDNDANDMETKCRNLWNAIVAAHGAVSNLPIATHPLAERERTLKIFMAPEFYFRGRNGAYSPDIVSSIIPRMRALGTANGTYKDWLFVFGTAVAAIETQVTYCPTCGYNNSTIRYDRDPLNPAKTIAKCSLNPAHVPTTGNWGAEVQNVALIQHGGDTHLVAKEYVSGIDYRNAPKILPTDPDRPTVRMPGGNYLDVSSPRPRRSHQNRRTHGRLHLLHRRHHHRPRGLPRPRPRNRRSSLRTCLRLRGHHPDPPHPLLRHEHRHRYALQTRRHRLQRRRTHRRLLRGQAQPPRRTRPGGDPGRRRAWLALPLRPLQHSRMTAPGLMRLKATADDRIDLATEAPPTHPLPLL